MNPFKNLFKDAAIATVFQAITVAIEQSGQPIHAELDTSGPSPTIKITGGEIGARLVHQVGVDGLARWEVTVRQDAAPLKTEWHVQTCIFSREITGERLPATLNFIMGGIAHHMREG